MNLLRSGDFAKLTWKNGLGVSHVIASDPPAAGYDAVTWQVGTTQFGMDCPFSNLPGMDRQFTLLSGDGVELHCIDVISGIDVRRAVDKPFVSFAFRGDWHTTCRMLGAPVRVFNVMTRRSKAAAKIVMPRFTGALFCEQPRGQTVIAVLLAGSAKVGVDSAPLYVDDAVVLDAPNGEQCEFVATGADARIAVVRISPARA